MPVGIVFRRTGKSAQDRAANKIKGCKPSKFPFDINCGQFARRIPVKTARHVRSSSSQPQGSRISTQRSPSSKTGQPHNTTMRSRLAELTGGDPSDAGDVELGNASSNYMGDFFAKVDEAKAGISAVEKASKRIRRITDERMLATSTNEEQGASRELGPLVDRTNATIKQTKNLLNELAEEDSSLKASEQRIRKNLASTLARKFGDVCQDYQKEQTRYKDEVQATVKRQLEIVQPDVSQEEIDTVLRSGGPGQVMRSAILRGAADPVKDAYAHAADRYQDVLKLEQSVAELHQMFLDFALLTEQQGEMLDQIEYQVKAAGEYVEEGNVDIKKAIQYQKEIRKRYCCLIVLILVIVLVLMGVLGAFDQEDTDKEDRRRLRDLVGA
mgnify:CR=1 FL=1